MMSIHLSPKKAAELRLRTAEAEVRAAREALDALTPPSPELGYEKPAPAPLTHEVHLSEQQVWVLIDALDFYSRWCRGHFVLPNVVEFRTLPARDPYGRAVARAGRPAVEDWDGLRDDLRRLRARLFPEFDPGSHGGVGWNGQGSQQHYQIAYEVRKALTAERNRRLGISNVDSGPWLHYSDQPHPVVRVFDPQLGVAEHQQFMAEFKRKFPPYEGF